MVQHSAPLRSRIWSAEQFHRTIVCQTTGALWQRRPGIMRISFFVAFVNRAIESLPMNGMPSMKGIIIRYIAKLGLENNIFLWGKLMLASSIYLARCLRLPFAIQSTAGTRNTALNISSTETAHRPAALERPCCSGTITRKVGRWEQTTTSILSSERRTLLRPPLAPETSTGLTTSSSTRRLTSQRSTKLFKTCVNSIWC